MICADARPLLNLLCDQALETKDSAIVLAHLQTCDECLSEWRQLEDLRARFIELRNLHIMPDDLMAKVSRNIRAEERRSITRPVIKALPLAFVATLLLIGLLLTSQYHSQSAYALVEDSQAENRENITAKVDFPVKHVNMDDWTLTHSSVYHKIGSGQIARFEFERKSAAGKQSLVCYQALQGTIKANGAIPEQIGEKKVFFGTHARRQFALWSQGGRDYLFVTQMSKDALAAVVRRA
ncbi:MAG: zf-HC2 domain-containing protein [Cyanobacteria bacterium SZAS LIN-2]|nr:zf-HC2 domain-containing protein [Cyanobacteria bacterium SZAS LIN-2]